MESGCSDFWDQATFRHIKCLRRKWNFNVMLSSFFQDPESSILIRVQLWRSLSEHLDLLALTVALLGHYSSYVYHDVFW